MQYPCSEHALIFTQILREKLLKATPSRLIILDVLTHSAKPLSAKDVQTKLKDNLDLATLYRTFETLRSSNLVSEVDLKHGHAHYEVTSKNHHHHVICENCGKVVDISDCNLVDLEKQILKKSGFKKINSHSLEFFGLCEKCTK